jgi:hypothetical protein
MTALPAKNTNSSSRGCEVLGRGRSKAQKIWIAALCGKRKARIQREVLLDDYLASTINPYRLQFCWDRRL